MVSVPTARSPPTRLQVVVVVVMTIAIPAGTVLWAYSPSLFPPQHSPPVVLLGINRTVTYEGSTSGYLTGQLTSGCPSCPLTIPAGSSASLNVSWTDTRFAGTSLSYIFVNITINSPYPWEGPSGSGVFYHTDREFWEVGYPGGALGIPFTIVIPNTYSNLPAAGYVNVYVNASAR
jgi:hypothetical protein